MLPLFRIAGLQPNLVLVLFIAWLMVRGPGEAFVLIPIGGLFLGLVDGAPLGTALLALAPLAIVQEIRADRLSESGLVLTIVFTVGMTIVYHLVYLGVFTVRGEAGSWLTAVTRVIIPTALLNAVVLLPLYCLVNSLASELRRPAYYT